MTTLDQPAASPIDSIDAARRLYRLMQLTRLMDERLWIVVRQGKAHFVLTGRGSSRQEWSRPGLLSSVAHRSSALSG